MYTAFWFLVGVALFVAYEFVKAMLDEAFFSSTSFFNTNKFTQIVRYLIYAPVQIFIWSLMLTTFCVCWVVIDGFTGILDKSHSGTSYVITERPLHDISDTTKALYENRYGKHITYININDTVVDPDYPYNPHANLFGAGGKLSPSMNGPYCIYTKPGLCDDKINQHYFYPSGFGFFEFAVPDGNQYIIGDASDHPIRTYFLPSPRFDVVNGKMVTTKITSLGQYWGEWAFIFSAWYILAFFPRIIFSNERYFPQTA